MIEVDPETLSRDELIAEVRKLQQGIRTVQAAARTLQETAKKRTAYEERILQSVAGAKYEALLQELDTAREDARIANEHATRLELELDALRTSNLLGVPIP